jgi:hypothetical protein
LTGVCTCDQSFGSSNGFGGTGSRADCGHQTLQLLNYTQFNISNLNQTVFNTTISTNCPFSSNKVCAGNGLCDASIGKCDCFEGFEGGDCSKKSCGWSRAWFGNVGTNHEALAMCSGVGDCDYSTGICMNCGGSFGLFAGDMCERLSCYTDENGNECRFYIKIFF